MKDCFDISDDDLARLAGVAKIEPGLMVAFKTAMREEAVAYFMAKNAPFFKNTDAKSKTNKLKMKARLLVSALDEFEKALNDFPHELRHPASKLKDEDVRLYRHQRSSTEVQACRKIIKADTEVWGDCASIAHTAIGKLPPGGGDHPFNRLLNSLITVYATGGKEVKQPTYSYIDEKYSGPLFEFIDMCFDLFGEEKVGNFGKNIGHAVERWKKYNSPEPT